MKNNYTQNYLNLIYQWNNNQQLNDIKAQSIEEKIKIDENPNTPTQILSKLAQDKDGGVRRKVAENPNTSIQILSKLAQDQEGYVRYAVGKNPNTPPQIFRDELAQEWESLEEFYRIDWY